MKAPFHRAFEPEGVEAKPDAEVGRESTPSECLEI
jgi:hypothetical protein